MATRPVPDHGVMIPDAIMDMIPARKLTPKTWWTWVMLRAHAEENSYMTLKEIQQIRKFRSYHKIVEHVIVLEAAGSAQRHGKDYVRAVLPADFK